MVLVNKIIKCKPFLTKTFINVLLSDYKLVMSIKFLLERSIIFIM